MNPRWLSRAKLFETPRPVLARCSRGHNVEREGIYITTKTVNGKAYKSSICARCRIDDVQAYRSRKRLEKRLAA